MRNLVLDSECIKQRLFSEDGQMCSILEINELATSIIVSHSVEEHERAQEVLMGKFIELIVQAIDDKLYHDVGTAHG